jgi:hypothetical protein
MNDYFADDDIDDGEENSLVCEACERYQQEIYRLNRLLRDQLSTEEYQKTRGALEIVVQVQLRHQREHAG